MFFQSLGFCHRLQHKESSEQTCADQIAILETLNKEQFIIDSARDCFATFDKPFIALKKKRKKKKEVKPNESSYQRWLETLTEKQLMQQNCRVRRSPLAAGCGVRLSVPRCSSWITVILYLSGLNVWVGKDPAFHTHCMGRHRGGTLWGQQEFRRQSPAAV